MKILMLEDEEATREIIQVFLKHQLSEVILEIVEATDGNEAMKIYRKHGPFDLVITDQLHEGPLGTEVAKRIHRINPAQRIAIMTGPPSIIKDRYRKHFAFFLWKGDKLFLENFVDAILATIKQKAFGFKNTRTMVSEAAVPGCAVSPGRGSRVSRRIREAMAKNYWSVTCPKCRLTIRVGDATSDDPAKPPVFSGAPEETLLGYCDHCERSYTFRRKEVRLDTQTAP